MEKKENPEKERGARAASADGAPGEMGLGAGEALCKSSLSYLLTYTRRQRRIQGVGETLARDENNEFLRLRTMRKQSWKGPIRGTMRSRSIGGRSQRKPGRLLRRSKFRRTKLWSMYYYCKR